MFLWRRSGRWRLKQFCRSVHDRTLALEAAIMDEMDGTAQQIEAALLRAAGALASKQDAAHASDGGSHHAESEVASASGALPAWWQSDAAPPAWAVAQHPVPYPPHPYPPHPHLVWGAPLPHPQLNPVYTYTPSPAPIHFGDLNPSPPVNRTGPPPPTQPPPYENRHSAGALGTSAHPLQPLPRPRSLGASPTNSTSSHGRPRPDD